MQKPRFSNLPDWLSWQESLHGKEIDLGLERIRIVYERMGLVWVKTKFITVGGTNGKGSTIAFLNAIYQQAGHKVGQFTSPHFLRYNERIQLNSQQIDDESLCNAFAVIDEARGGVSLSYFEFSTLAGLYIFAQQQVDVVLMEVGLGGRLDASNLIDADCAIVTSIGIDHRDWLGDTREQIGFEKAGIYRRGKPAICGDLDIPHSVQSQAEEVDAQWWGREQQFSVLRQGDAWQLEYADQQLAGLPYPALLAPVQLNNAACAVLAVQLLQGYLAVPQVALFQGIRIAAVPGRMQSIKSPEGCEVLLDVAHNEDAAQSVVAALQGHYADRPLRIVLGMLADKEVEATLAVLQQLQAIYYVAAPASPRALSAGAMAAQLESQGAQLECIAESIAGAYQQALSDSEKGAVVVVLGSFFTVAEVMGLFDEAGV